MELGGSTPSGRTSATCALRPAAALPFAGVVAPPARVPFADSAAGRDAGLVAGFADGLVAGFAAALMGFARAAGFESAPRLAPDDADGFFAPFGAFFVPVAFREALALRGVAIVIPPWCPEPRDTHRP